MKKTPFIKLSLNSLQEPALPSFGWVSSLAILLVLMISGIVSAQPPQCDPTKVLSVEACAKCHQGEVAAWQKTPHFETFETLHRNPRAKEIAGLMGQQSIKRGNLCINCHYTLKLEGDTIRAVSGVSCESCHGAAADWLALHNDYGGPTATKETESDSHRQKRMDESMAAGMRNPVNLYLVAQSCLNCHTVPNEALVNVGTHKAGSDDFELVAWSQGMVRHNFLRTNGQSNATNPIEKLRVMYIVGQIADLEYSTRATGLATERSTYGMTSAKRAAAVAVRLYQIQQRVHDPLLEKILKTFSSARLAINNRSQLDSIAGEIKKIGIEFAIKSDGSKLEAVDPWLPKPETYK